jgi:hypothetical protein
MSAGQAERTAVNYQPHGHLWSPELHASFYVVFVTLYDSNKLHEQFLQI